VFGKIAAVDAARNVEPERSPGYLGDVLYPDKTRSPAAEAQWVALVQAMAAGNQPALHALYERAHRPVFTLIVRITANRETAEELTLDVFHDVWRRASRYDAADGTVLGWIMNQARSRALDRLRFERRHKRAQVDGEDPSAAVDAADPADVVAFNQQGRALRTALEVLTPEERTTIAAAFFAELTHAEAAARLNEPLGTVKSRIRSGLHKLRLALGRKTPAS
jgi:RNA polymerase sigma-70 factor (ECF subfamily)